MATLREAKAVVLVEYRKELRREVELQYGG
jgi:hypothetical protein